MDKDYLIEKWLADELSTEESKAFEAMDDAPYLKGIVENASAFKASRFSKMDGYQQFKKHLELAKPQDAKIRWIRPLMRIASIFVVGFSMYYLFIYENLTTVETHIGEKVTVTLPDASTIHVNALSEIAYNEKKWNQKREITLEGEAFFDVAKGSKFNVVTTSGTVTVLGTEFNVKQRKNLFEVRCFEGKVQVVAGAHEATLLEGDNLRFFNGSISKGKNTFSVAQWTKNISNFQRVEVSEVFAELERQYKVGVALENVNTKQLFSGGFVHDNLENALKSITEPLNLDYEFIATDKVRVKPREK
ncbi:FecR family protein [Flagellimonas sp. S3867]|uniref:FecR family protein n=1 Tax=Flagellimonas sp. S3867 TaxID=2768063 RepID=UPI001686FD1C|nr:FecR domain-containing protein [Flagellimonas sp. S3867]